MKKYWTEYKDRIIPLVIRHNATIYEPSLALIRERIPDVTFKFLCKHACIATVRYEHMAELKATKKIKQ